MPDAILLATPRTASSACLSHALSIVAPHGCIDLVGGFPEAARLPELPSTVPNEVRATHCCGLPPSVRPLKVTTKSGKPISLIGHRGVASSQLLAAAETLARGILGGAFDPLVTHMLTMQEAADLMERLQKHGSRHINGQRFIKVAINLCTTGAPHTHA